MHRIALRTGPILAMALAISIPTIGAQSDPPDDARGVLPTDAAGKPTVLASSKRHGRRMTVKLLQPVAIPAGSVAQLWALPVDGSAAFPVGVIPGSGSATVALADTSEKLFFRVSRLAVSIEAAPARDGDKPSGDYVLSGHCVKHW